MIQINQGNLILLLTALSTTLKGTGLSDQADAVMDLVELYQSGKNIDAHMALVAEALNSNLPIDWPKLRDRIVSNSAKIAGG